MHVYTLECLPPPPYFLNCQEENKLYTIIILVPMYVPMWCKYLDVSTSTICRLFTSFLIHLNNWRLPMNIHIIMVYSNISGCCWSVNKCKLTKKLWENVITFLTWRKLLTLSLVIPRSPSYTWMSTPGWLSEYVVKVWHCLVGMVVLRLMSDVITPPAVSIPKESGATSRRRRSETSSDLSPERMAACTARKDNKRGRK